MQQTIVKVQLPLAGLSGPALMNDEFRLHEIVRPLTVREARMHRDRQRAFYAAQWDDATGWTLLNRAPEQDW